jgi:hypothetical protein
VDEDVRILEDGLHPLRVGHEVGREVAAVELHALDHLERGLQALGLLDRDDALFSSSTTVWKLAAGAEAVDGFAVDAQERCSLARGHEFPRKSLQH